MYLGYHPLQIYFDLTGLAILLAIVCCLIGLIAVALRRKRSAVFALASVMLVLSAVQVFRGTMVSDAAWVAMLSAIESATGPERARRIIDLRAHWQARTMRAVDWYLLTRKWNVCHDLWVEPSCVRPAASVQGVGIARDLLDDMADLIVTFPNSARSFSTLPRYEVTLRVRDVDERHYRLELTELATGSTVTAFTFHGRVETRWSRDDRYVAISHAGHDGMLKVFVYSTATKRLLEVPWPATATRYALDHERCAMWAIGWISPTEIRVNAVVVDHYDGKPFAKAFVHRMPPGS